MKFCKGMLVSILIIIIVVIFIKIITIGYSNKEVIAIQVKDKYIKRYNDADIYMVVDEDNNTYQITDLFFIGKFNSTDIYNSLDIGQVYFVETSGIRNYFFSWYKNINKIIQ